MKKKVFVLDIISFCLIVFNTISFIAFLLPPGRAYYMPDLLMRASMGLTMYSFFGLGLSGIVGAVLNIISVILKRRKGNKIKGNIIYILLFLLTVFAGWFVFNVAMSV